MRESLSSRFRKACAEALLLGTGLRMAAMLKSRESYPGKAFASVVRVHGSFADEAAARCGDDRGLIWGGKLTVRVQTTCLTNER